MLSRREYAVAELQRKLRTKFPEDPTVDEVVDRLVEEGMVCDRRFADAFVRSRVTRLQGPRKIRAELKRRSVGDPLIDEALEGAVDSWTALAADWLTRQRHDPADYQSRAKYYRRLVNRGFTHDQAMDALNQRKAPEQGV